MRHANCNKAKIPNEIHEWSNIILDDAGADVEGFGRGEIGF